MKIPADPKIGSVISYSYLWAEEADAGRHEGTKDRPAAIVMARTDLGPAKLVYVLPVTHSPPTSGEVSRKVEIPPAVKKALKLDDLRSWVVVDELNVFVWPGFDLRPVPGSDPQTCEYGILPNGFFERLKTQMLSHGARGRTRIVKRGE